MAKRAKPGDILETKTPDGFVYLQYLGAHPKLGGTVLVCPKKFSERPALSKDLFADGYVTFYTVGPILAHGLAAVVAHLAVSREVPHRLRRAGVSRPGEPEPWVIEDGTKNVVKQELSDEEKLLPLAEIWNHEMLLYRINEGWRPEVQGAVARVPPAPTSPSVGGERAELKHYLYADSPADGAKIALVLKVRGFAIEQRPGADGTKWLVLASHSVALSDEVVEKDRAFMETTAKRFGVEYDGWEADVAGPARGAPDSATRH
jgi:hypothetical protein